MDKLDEIHLKVNILFANYEIERLGERLETYRKDYLSYMHNRGEHWKGWPTDKEMIEAGYFSEYTVKEKKDIEEQKSKLTRERNEAYEQLA